VTPRHALRNVQNLFPKQRPPVPVRYSHADQHLRLIRALPRPSVIAVVSSSKIFLDVARSVLAPAMGSRHELREIYVAAEDVSAARSADVVFCDSIAKKRVRLAKAIHYSLLAKYREVRGNGLGVLSIVRTKLRVARRQCRPPLIGKAGDLQAYLPALSRIRWAR
jgi:hypothetical protein